MTKIPQVEPRSYQFEQILLERMAETMVNMGTCQQVKGLVLLGELPNVVAEVSLTLEAGIYK